MKILAAVLELPAKLPGQFSPHYLQLKLLSGKNVRAWVSMDFTQDKFSAPIAIEKIKILGAPWELLAKQHCQSSPFTSNLGQIGQIGSAV